MPKTRGGRNRRTLRILAACKNSATSDYRDFQAASLNLKDPTVVVDELLEFSENKPKKILDESLVSTPINNECKTYFNTTSDNLYRNESILVDCTVDELPITVSEILLQDYIQVNDSYTESLTENNTNLNKAEFYGETLFHDEPEYNNSTCNDQHCNIESSEATLENQINESYTALTENNNNSLNKGESYGETFNDEPEYNNSTYNNQQSNLEATPENYGLLGGKELQLDQHENEEANTTISKNLTEEIGDEMDDFNGDPNYVADTDEHSDSSSKQEEMESNKENQNKKFTVKLVKERKRNRNLGKAYVTAKGKKIEARAFKPLRDNCRTKCKSFLTENDRKIIFDEYWSLESHDRRVAFISGLVSIQETKLTRKKLNNGKAVKNRVNTYTYKFQINNQQKIVCKTCFLNTLGETEKFLSCSMKNKLSSSSGVTHEDQRGRHSPLHKTSQQKLDQVKEHILSFPAYKSHYSRRHSNKKYLAANLNINLMYKLYCEKYLDKPVSINIYSREFHKLGLKFKKPKNDTCNKCDTLTAREKYSNSDEEKKQIRKELENHQAIADKAYEAKSNDKQKGLEDPSYVTYAFDLQQVLPTPYLTTNKMFYLRQLSTYNLTIHNCSTGESSHFMWPETTGGRGANDIASCLFRFIKAIPEEVKSVVFYSDTCGGQNKNQIVISMFHYIIHQHPSLEVIDHKFLIPGHTHLECDVDHSVIERAKKRCPFEIHVPRDWYQLVRTASKRNNFKVFVMESDNFYSFSDIHTKGPLQKKTKDFKIRDVCWLRYTKTNTVSYKFSLDMDEEFKEISFLRKGSKIAGLKSFEIPNLYDESRPINKLKKQNLLEIVSLLDKDVQSFYRNLKTDKNVEKDTDPDIDRLYSDEDCQ